MASFGQEEAGYWRYFLSIERDLVSSRRFCEISVRNFESFSDEYAKIVILSSIHFEFIVKTLLKERLPSASLQDIVTIREQLMGLRPGIATMKVPLPSAGIDVSPLTAWRNNKSPDWWTAYTRLKHDYGGNRNRGNQRNAVEALAACMTALLYFLEDDIPNIEPYPIILYYDRPPFLLGYPEPWQKLP
jgi:hypothetical protein